MRDTRWTHHSEQRAPSVCSAAHARRTGHIHVHEYVYRSHSSQYAHVTCVAPPPNLAPCAGRSGRSRSALPRSGVRGSNCKRQCGMKMTERASAPPLMESTSRWRAAPRASCSCGDPEGPVHRTREEELYHMQWFAFSARRSTLGREEGESSAIAYDIVNATRINLTRTRPYPPYGSWIPCFLISLEEKRRKKPANYIPPWYLLLE